MSNSSRAKKKISSDLYGVIPQHWKIQRIKFIGNVENGATPASATEMFWNGDIKWVTPTDIRSGSRISETSRTLTESGLKNCGANLVPKNSIVLSIRAPIGKVAIAEDSLCTSQGCKSIVVFERNVPEFLYYQLSGLSDYLNSLGTGTTFMEIGTKVVKNLLVVLPPKYEQEKIVSYLDQKTTQIDKAIRVKEQQITLLKERKQILIRTAVTRGLNPDAPMRDSGVEWIGEVPGHWEVQRFKNLFTQSRLSTRPDDGVVTAYRDGQVTLRSNRRLDGYTEAILEGGYQGIRKGQLVLNSMDAFEGAIGISDSEGKCTPEYVICDPVSDQFLPEYFALLLREMALAKYIQVICNAVRQRAVRIRFNNLAPRPMVVPPVEEQKAIVKRVSAASKEYSRGITLLEKQITKLKEYRATLINSAVTGKIKVPGVMEPGNEHVYRTAESA